MNEDEVREFEKNDYLEQCLKLRYWDDDAKDPRRLCPSFSFYRPLIESLVKY
jgi:predicted HD phosphohydrolase